MRAVARRISGVVGVIIAVWGVTGITASATPNSRIGVLVPIIADAGDGQLIAADVLESETSADGDWLKLAELSHQHGLTIAIDSRILASIDALGNDAPASALAWRDGVVDDNPLVLPWGNADVWAYTTWASNPFTAEQFAALASVTPDALTIWPSGRVVSHDSVATTARRGFATMLVFDDQFSGGLSRSGSDLALAAVKPGSTVLASQAALDIRSILSNGGSIALPADPAQFDVDNAVALVNDLDRGPASLGKVSPVGVLSSSAPRTEVPGPESLNDLMNAYAVDEERAASIATDVPAFLQSRLKSLTAVTAKLGTDGFDNSVADFVDDTRWISDMVSISLASEYTVLSNTADVPVSVSNASNSAVTVTVAVRSTSGIVQVNDSRQDVTIEPRSNVRITVPMTAVANGRTVLVAKLFDANNDPIGPAVSFPIEVQAQWEIVTVVVFFGSVSIIMTIGIVRTIRRRRAVA